MSGPDPNDPGYLERLRSWRGPRGRDLALKKEMGELIKQVRAMSRATEGIGAVWTKVAPEGLASRVAVVAIRRGVLTLKPESSSARYELDRWLKGGGEQRLIGLAPVTLARVKLV